MDSDAQLNRWYRQFNDRYWAGELPEEVEVYYAPCEEDGEYACCRDFNDRVKYVDFEICISDRFVNDRIISKLWLLHEMNHLDTWDEKTMHGKRFHAGIQRLVKIGAYKKLL